MAALDPVIFPRKLHLKITPILPVVQVCGLPDPIGDLL
jgi:hypothetical protein